VPRPPMSPVSLSDALIFMYSADEDMFDAKQGMLKERDTK
jgi:hypothetical protein